MNDIYVRLINLPSSVKGVTVLDENDDYNIYINQKLSPEQQKKVYEHEKNHIDNGDFHNFDEIEEVEDRAEKEKAKNLPVFDEDMGL